MAVFGVYGASGCGRDVMPIIRKQFAGIGRCVFVDDAVTDRVNGVDCLSYAAFLALNESDKRIAVAIANSQTRAKLMTRVLDDGITIAEIIADTVLRGDDCNVGEGAVVCSYTILTSNISIGRGFQGNLACCISHDCVIGDFVTFAPGVICNGNVHIGDHAYLGSGAVIKQGSPDCPLTIGEGAVIGMGAVVTRNVAPHTVVVGNPARPLSK